MNMDLNSAVLFLILNDLIFCAIAVACYAVGYGSGARRVKNERASKRPNRRNADSGSGRAESV